MASETTNGHSTLGKELLLEEQWKSVAIPNYEHFLISNYGRVFNSKTNHYIAIGDNGRGYKNCKLKSKGKTITVYIHRLVAQAFLTDWDITKQVNHIDKNKSNNKVTNLEMVNDSQNKQHSQNEYVIGHINAQGKVLEVYDLNDNLILEYQGIYDFCRKYNHDPSAVYKVLNGKIKSHHNLKFKIRE